VPRSHDEASFGDLELPDLPVRAGFGDAELPMPHAHSDRARGLSSDEASFGDLDLGGPEMAEESFSDVRSDDLVQLKQGGEPLQTESIPAEYAEHGEESYGEAGLTDEQAEEDMEFGIAPGDENLGLPPELLRRNQGEAEQAEEAASGKRALRVLIGVAAALVLLGGGGAAMGLTDHGFFAVYYLEQFLPEAADARFAHEAIARAEKTASTDTYRDVQRGLKVLGDSRHKAGLNRELLTRSLLHESLFDVRFGSHASSAAHSAAILARLDERHGRAPGMELGRAADAARRGDYAEAERKLEAARAESGEDAYFALLEGEVALRQNKLAEADKAFARGLKQGGAARAQWGLARVALARTDVAAQRTAVDETLRLSPEHVEARLALARLLWNSDKQNEASAELDRALGRERVGERFLWASKAARAGSYSMLGFVNESRGHLSQARKAYDEALAADPYMLEALLGAGRVLLRERRWNDALARFESGLNLAKSGNVGLVMSGRRADVEARLGQSHAQLALNRAPEAKATLAQLMKDNPNDAEIVRAAGQAEAVLGAQNIAEELFIKSIELAPSTFAGYLALAQHYFKQGRADKASETLNEAASKVEENVEMRRMLGQSELARGRFESAVHEFTRATELDPGHGVPQNQRAGESARIARRDRQARRPVRGPRAGAWLVAGSAGQVRGRRAGLPRCTHERSQRHSAQPAARSGTSRSRAPGGRRAHASNRHARDAQLGRGGVLHGSARTRTRSWSGCAHALRSRALTRWHTSDLPLVRRTRRARHGQPRPHSRRSRSHALTRRFDGRCILGARHRADALRRGA
jgi:tetratricopeptide (TPR) repeat protein